MAVFWKAIEGYYLDFQLAASIEARRKLRYYAKPLWLDCHDLVFRLEHICHKGQSAARDEALSALRLIPAQHATSLEWYTKDGYYSVSTAYLLSSVACWIRLFERDVVFLDFGNRGATAAFFRVIERLKRRVSSRGSVLWYHYFNGIGEQLMARGEKRPLTIAEFTTLLSTDPSFAAYYDQLFQFLQQVTAPELHDLLTEIIASLREIQRFLEDQRAVPRMVSDATTP